MKVSGLDIERLKETFEEGIEEEEFKMILSERLRKRQKETLWKN